MKKILKVMLITSVIASLAMILIFVFSPDQKTKDLEHKLERQKCVTEFALNAKNFSNTMLLAKKQNIDFEPYRRKVKEDSTLTCEQIRSLWSEFSNRVYVASGAQ